jgi:thioesterase domain-containing protein/aryl carrier-like protein
MAEPNTAEAATARLSCDTVERVICELWSGYFGRAVSPYDDFFDLGGDSLAMIDVVGQARERGLAVRSSVALRNPTPARLAETLTVHAASAPVTLPALCAPEAMRTPLWTDPAPEPIVPGDIEPLYVVHSDSHIQAERDAVSAWDSPRPVLGLPLPGSRGPIPPFGTVDEVADRFLATLKPAEPYRLAGFGLGAVVAFEMARRLTGRGEPVALLALIAPPEPAPAADPGTLLRERLAMLARRFGLDGDESVEDIHARVRRDGWYDDGVFPSDLPRLQQSWVDLTVAARSHRPGPYGGPAVLFLDSTDSTDSTDPADGGQAWQEAIPDLAVHRFDHGISSPVAVLRDERLADVMRRALKP